MQDVYSKILPIQATCNVFLEIKMFHHVIVVDHVDVDAVIVEEDPMEVMEAMEVMEETEEMVEMVEMEEEDEKNEFHISKNL